MSAETVVVSFKRFIPRIIGLYSIDNITALFQKMVHSLFIKAVFDRAQLCIGNIPITQPRNPKYEHLQVKQFRIDAPNMSKGGFRIIGGLH